MIAETSKRLIERLEELGNISDDANKLVRTFSSPAQQRTSLLVGEWMCEAGLEVREDLFHNVIGYRAGPPGSKVLVIGSHLDTVIDAGKFDGALGVLLGISVAECVKDLPFGLEIVGFADEEGLRFHSTYLGSRAYAGLLGRAELDLCDAQGISVANAVGLKSSQAKLVAGRPAAELLGYLEVHIEQGPILESLGQPLGVVSVIGGQTRIQAGFVGKAGHAGTVPMNLRKDALTAAAEMILAVENYAKCHPPLVATVGSIQAIPGASNVIAGRVAFTLEVRSPNDLERVNAVEFLSALGPQIASRRGLEWTWDERRSTSAVRCDPGLTEFLSTAVSEEQATVPQLVSGAGHDAVVMADLTPTVMLFVRCRDGLSHHPDEYACPADIVRALRASILFVRRLSNAMKTRISL